MHDDDLNAESMDEQEMDEDDGTDAWIVTFADISMLLLVFFVLLFSMSDINETSFTDSFTSVRQALGQDKMRADTSRVTSDEGAVLESVKLQRQLLEAQKKVFSEVKTYMTRSGVEGIVGATLDEGTITLRVASEVLFEPGQVELTAAGKKSIMPLLNFFIQHNDQRINIKGYTDDQPPGPGAKYTDNWEISALRAVNVLRFLLEQGIETNRVTATGLASTDPLFPNTTDDNRARNRRVEFVLEKNITK